MLNFKQYLLEENTAQLTTATEVKALLQHPRFGINTVSDYQVLKDGRVNVKRRLCHFKWFNYAANNTDLDPNRLPFKFKLFSDNLTIHSDSITDISGAPEKGGYLTIKAFALKTLQGLEGQYTDLALQCPELTEFNCKVKTEYVFINDIKSFNAKDFASSFSPLEQNVKVRLNFGLTAAEKLLYKTPLLGLLKSQNFGSIGFIEMSSTTNPKLQEIAKVCRIINENVGNIIAAQEELFKNDLDEYAKL